VAQCPQWVIRVRWTVGHPLPVFPTNGHSQTAPAFLKGANMRHWQTRDLIRQSCSITATLHETQSWAEPSGAHRVSYDRTRFSSIEESDQVRSDGLGLPRKVLTLLLHQIWRKINYGSTVKPTFGSTQTKAISFARLPRSSSRQDLLSLTSVCSSVGPQILGAGHREPLRAAHLPPFQLNNIDRASETLLVLGQWKGQKEVISLGGARRMNPAA
jgi:hypothetical protein